MRLGPRDTLKQSGDAFADYAGATYSATFQVKERSSSRSK